jgi:hypothetical protein
MPSDATTPEDSNAPTEPTPSGDVDPEAETDSFGEPAPLPFTPLTISVGVITLAFVVLGIFYITDHHAKRAVLAFILAAAALAATIYTYVATRETTDAASRETTDVA